MKLRNKRTGEIVEDAYVRETHDFQFDGQKHVLAVFKGNGHSVPERISGPYNSLAELNAEWEDYEEPAGWSVTMYGGIGRITGEDEALIPELKEIGNYFNDKESAYDTLEKLKAWKRLKDKGVELYGWRRNQTGTYELYLRWEDRIPRSYEVKNDLNLLFGGEE